MLRLGVPVGVFVGAGLVLAMGLGSAQAEISSPVVNQAAVCANCHGTEGRQAGAIPRIAGQPAPLLAAKLKDFRDGSNVAWTVMPRLAKGLTDQEIEQLSTYYSQIR